MKFASSVKYEMFEGSGMPLKRDRDTLLSFFISFLDNSGRHQIDCTGLSHITVLSQDVLGGLFRDVLQSL